MDFVNTTPLPADLSVTDVAEGLREGMLVAKATFRVEPGGAVLERDEPDPIRFEDEETELGLLPRDNLPRRGRELEVMVLGRAHAPTGRKVERMLVSLRVGEHQRSLLVTGDRVWLDRQRCSAPQPFDAMPLTWARAFGGSVLVEVDREAFVDIPYPRNPAGRGFDARPSIDALAKQWKVPAGYPRWDQARPLPNVEDPGAPITAWADEPTPAGFAPLPLSSALHAERAVAVEAQPLAMTVDERAFFRAPPALVLPLPPRGAPVALDGMTKDQRLAFALPELAVWADYVVGDYRGSRPLAPQALLLLPETRRFTLVYRLHFNLPHRLGEERSMRLRTSEGWFDWSA